MSVVKIVIWSVFAFLLLVWTGFALMTVEALQWLAAGIESGQAIDPVVVAESWVLPAWFALWFDPLWLTLARQMLLALLVMAVDALPVVVASIGWIVPLLWLTWGVGVVMLLLCTGFSLWLVQKFAPASMRAEPTRPVPAP